MYSYRHCWCAGRIGDVAPTAMLDLAKPAYKMGLAEVRVGWAAHELAGEGDAREDVYPVRGKASVAIAVRRADGSAPPPVRKLRWRRSMRACSNACPTIRGSCSKR
jgi:hypothetical protein